MYKVFSICKNKLSSLTKRMAWLETRLKSIADLFDPDAEVYVALGIGRIGIVFGIALRFWKRGARDDLGEWLNRGIFVILLVYAFGALYLWLRPLRSKKISKGIIYPLPPKNSWIIRPLEVWLQVTWDSLCFPMFYIATGNPESDLFLFLFLPVLQSAIFLPRYALGNIGVVGLILSICVILSNYKERGSPRKIESSMLATNVILPRVSFILFGGAVALWISTRFLRLRNKQGLFFKLDRQVQQCDNPHDVVKELVGGLCQVGYDRVRFWKFEEQTNELVLLFWKGHHPILQEGKKNIRIKRSPVTGEQIYNTGEVIICRLSSGTIQSVYASSAAVELGPKARKGMKDIDGNLKIVEWIELPIVLPLGEKRAIGQISIDNGITGIPFHDTDLEFLNHLVKVTQNTLVRIQVQQRLKRDTDRLHKLVDALPVQIFVKDIEGNFRTVNERCAKMIGCTKDKIIGKKDKDFFPSDLVEKYRKDDNRVMKERIILTDEEDFQLSNKSRIKIRVVKAPDLNPYGEAYFPH